MACEKYVDVKHTIWQRYHFNDEADMSKIIERAQKGEDFIDDELGFKYTEDLCETLDTISVEDNGGEATVEIYENNNIIWDNTDKDE